MRTNNQLYTSIKPGFSFYYDGLSYKEQVAYNAFLAALKKKEPSVDIPYLNNQEFNGVLTAIHVDHPEIYYFDFTLVNYITAGKGLRVTLKYKHLGKEKDVIDKINAILDLLRNKKTVMARLIGLCDYFYNLKYENTNSFEDHTIYGPLINGKGVCEGFSLLFSYICRIMKIDCTCISGQLEGQPHMWNIVQINNELYNIDITSSIGVYINKQIVKYAYICVPNRLLQTHRPELRMDCNYLNKNPYVLLGRDFKDMRSCQMAINNGAKKGKDFTIFDTSENQKMSNQDVLNIAVSHGATSVMNIDRYIRVIMKASWVKKIFG